MKVSRLLSRLRRKLGRPLTTIVVTPRERFSCAVRSLESIIEHTTAPHRLVYVSGNEPPQVCGLLESMCRGAGYDFVATNRYLGSNEARNIGLARVRTKYVVFVENDVLVTPGWLNALVDCAEANGADVVGPLNLYGEPSLGQCHTFGGDFYYERNRDGTLALEERHRMAYVDLRVKRLALMRSRCDYVEFHCLFARRTLFEKLGPLDERVICTAENIDLALAVHQVGGIVYSEPKSIVSVISQAGHLLYDAPFFEQRWSHDWSEASLTALQAKWNLQPNGPFLRDYRLFNSMYRDRCRRPSGSRHPAASEPVRTIDELVALMGGTYPEFAVDTVRQAFATLPSLCEGMEKKQERTILEHSIGTAANLARLDAPPAILVSALFHWAFRYGRFPTIVGSSHPDAARRWLQRKIGDQAEAQLWELCNLTLARARETINRTDLAEMQLTFAYAVIIQLAALIDTRLSGNAMDCEDLGALSNDDAAEWQTIYKSVAEVMRCETLISLLPDSYAAPAVIRGPGVESTKDEVQSTSQYTNTIRRPFLNTTELLEWLRPPPGPLLHSISLQPWHRQHGATLTIASALANDSDIEMTRQVRLRTASEPWSYASAVSLDPDGNLCGPVDIRIELEVTIGKLGVCVLWRDSTVDFVVPEVTLDPAADWTCAGPVELMIRLPEIAESGQLVFRNWATQPTEACIRSISVHRPPA